jgi:hypothetical protein
MAGLNDWQTRIGRLQDQLNQIDSLVNTFANTERSTSELVKKVIQMEDRVGQQENRIDAAEQFACLSNVTTTLFESIPNWLIILLIIRKFA